MHLILSGNLIRNTLLLDTQKMKDVLYEHISCFPTLHMLLSMPTLVWFIKGIYLYLFIIESISSRCAIHTEKIPNARTFAMLLGDLANMATRELDGAQHRRKGRGEMIIDGQIIPPFLRYRMDTCTWPMILVDVKPPLWTILFGGWSVRSFLGESIFLINWKG